MQTRKLGSTGIEVSSIGFGAWAIGGPSQLGEKVIGWGDVDDKQSLASLEAALDAGINFFDTSDTYGAGHSEELIGRAFTGKRDRVVIATKFGNRDVDGKWVKDFSTEHAKRAIDESLKRLRTDYVDLYQVHSPETDFVFTDELWNVLDYIVTQGKVRHYGVSVGSWDQGFTVMDAGKAETIQVVINMLSHEPVEGGLLKRSAAAKVGIIARVPLASGFLTGKFHKGHTFARNDHRSSMSRKEIDSAIDRVESLRPLATHRRQTLAQLALSWILSHPEVSVVIPGAKTVQQVRDNATAGDFQLLSDEEMRATAEAFAE